MRVEAPEHAEDPGRVVARAVVEADRNRLRPRGPWVTKGAPPWVQPVGRVGLPFTRPRGPPPRRGPHCRGAATRAAHAKAMKVARPRIEPGQSPASIASAQGRGAARDRHPRRLDAPCPTSADDCASRPSRRSWVRSIVFLDATVVNVALPAISGRPERQAWPISNGSSRPTLLAMVALLLVGGALGDQFGRRRRIFIDRPGSSSASPQSCCARSRRASGFLIAARAAPGPGTGALLVPGSLAIHRLRPSRARSEAGRWAPGPPGPGSRR